MLNQVHRNGITDVGSQTRGQNKRIAPGGYVNASTPKGT